MTTRLDTITAAQMRAILMAIWPRAVAYPDDTACESLAIAARVVRDRRKPEPPPDPTALKYGRLFLHHAATMQDRLEGEANRRVVLRHMAGADDVVEILDAPAHDRCRAALSALAEAERAVTAAIDGYCDAMREAWEDVDAARFIAAAVQRAWRSTAGTAAPASVNDADPLVRAVRDVLEATGRSHSAAAISAVLRGKNERLRHARHAGDG